MKPIKLEHWVVCDGELFGRNNTRQYSPTRTGFIPSSPHEFKEGDLIENFEGTIFELGKPIEES